MRENKICEVGKVVDFDRGSPRQFTLILILTLFTALAAGSLCVINLKVIYFVFGDTTVSMGAKYQSIDYGSGYKDCRRVMDCRLEKSPYSNPIELTTDPQLGDDFSVLTPAKNRLPHAQNESLKKNNENFSIPAPLYITNVALRI